MFFTLTSQIVLLILRTLLETPFVLSCNFIEFVTIFFQFFIDPYKLLPLQRFLEQPKRGGRGGGRGGGGKFSF